MRCVECGELLPLYVGGELDANLRDEVKAHLGSCSECSTELKELQRAWNTLVSSPTPSVRSDFVAAVLVKTLGQRKSPVLSRVRSILSYALSSGRHRVAMAFTLSLAVVSLVATLTLHATMTPVGAWQETLDAMKNVESAHFIGQYIHDSRVTRIEGWFKHPDKFRWDWRDRYDRPVRAINDGTQAFVVDLSTRLVHPYSPPLASLPQRLQNILFDGSGPVEKTLSLSGTQVRASWLGQYRGAPARVQVKLWSDYYDVLEFVVPQETYEMRWHLYIHPTSRLVMGLHYQRYHMKTCRIFDDLKLSEVRYNVKLSDELFTSGLP